jgi:NodT family efflux transporter outer membrane factor (OMF) lipoprotein
MPFASATFAAIAAALALAVLGGCAVGPDYVQPAVEVPGGYKENPNWKLAEPQQVDFGDRWWRRYGDSELDRLVDAANAANQTVRQAEAQYRQARAVLEAAHAGYWPTIGATVSAARGVVNNGNAVQTSIGAGLSASWEPDLWGSVRRSVESGEAAAQASAADLAAARLSIQSALAQNYLQLRFIDIQRSLYADTIAAYAKALQLTQAQYGAGVTLRSDVALAETQLKSTQAAAADLEAQRSAFEHAIAILTGRPPALFALAPAPMVARLPQVPSALPSDLLERRPDVAAAERRAAAANAQIGVAQAAYFPAVTLSASGSGLASSLAGLINTPGRVWSLGAALAQTLFDGGLRRARTAEAVAAFDASAAIYRQTVLNGFQQVEDDLATLRVLDQETTLQEDAVRSAQLAERLALAQYRGGTATYLSVVTAQTLALSNERTAVQLRSRQMTTSVALIAAIGGGWSPAASVDAPTAVADDRAGGSGL